MKTFVAFAALLAALSVVPSALAVFSTGDVTNPVAPLLPAEAGPVPVFYATEDGTVYQESNGHDGLQSSPMTDENGVEIAPADSVVFTPAVPETPALPM